MASIIKVSITDSQQTVKIPTGIRMLVRRACTAVLIQEGFVGTAEVDVTFVENEAIRALNAEHRQVDAVTDVLSFPLGDKGIYDINPATGAKMLGDIVIAMPRALEQSLLYGHSLKREVAFLTVHSMLHLLGHDHVASGLESVRMREREEQVLLQLGLPRGGNYVLEDE